jgi:hypothetical protein
MRYWVLAQKHTDLVFSVHHVAFKSNPISRLRLEIGRRVFLEDELLVHIQHLFPVEIDAG